MPKREKTLVVDEELDKAIELLVALEFPFNNSRCLLCSGWMCSPNGETDFAHTKKCELGKFLAKHAADRPKRERPIKGKYANHDVGNSRG